MTAVQGSTAGDAFVDARRQLEGSALTNVHLRPAFDFTPAATRAAPGLAGSGAPVGPLHDAMGAIARREVSCRELVESALAAVDEHNDELVGLVEVAASRARGEADRLDAELAAGKSRGRLHGIPITVKDVIDVAGLPTRAGSLAYHEVPSRDAAAIERLRLGGAVVIGKASTHEFALGVTSPQSRNPHDATRIPGGSSGGSAIAVATGMGLASVGTDTRASIRVPAALCGVVGFKPTYGRIPTSGVVSLSWTMDHVASMAATVADAALLIDELAGRDGCAGAAGASVDGFRVGVPPAAFEGADPAVASVVARAIETLSDAGCSVIESDRPSIDDFDLASAAGLVVSRCEAATMHRGLGLDRSLYWEEVAEQLVEAEGLRAVDYLHAQRLRAQLGAELSEVFESVDALVMPTAGVVAQPVTDFADYLMVLARNAIPFSFLGFPALSVPCGAVGGLPVGLQFVAAPAGEPLLAAVGTAFEAARPA
ncbi:MAG: amidase [Actinobacteria bacterium]|nr:amidase [Actinomycetota bacterium]